jgi:Tol biopolymer transport system component
MGEVFRARDTRLDRSVAIKVLPGEFAHDASLKVRFEREAKAISQLEHPHICRLYDVGSANGIDYLVMELLEGESLADRIAKGPLPVDQVLTYGAQIAEALDRAHRAGVVHRDLKPGNIMITKSGAKLLDFGLAKNAAASGLGAQHSTLATEAKPLTERGTILGTFQYMAPEQLEGEEADARTDIFAFGAVLYEMATGRRAFEGKSKASLIASILGAEPQPLSAIVPTTPPALDRLIRTCLQKERDDRFQSARDVAMELRWLQQDPSAAIPTRRRRRGEAIAWSVTALMTAVAIILGALGWREFAKRRNAEVVRTLILPPEKASFDFLYQGGAPAISPDGRRIVFGAVEGLIEVNRGAYAPEKARTLWVRSLDSLAARQLAGTEGASYPFWSPDGRFIAFFADNHLKREDVNGGAPVSVCEAVDARGGSWSEDGRTIIFSGRYSPIYRVPATGGKPVEITRLGSGMNTHRWPEFLPDNQHFLFLASALGEESATNTIYAGSIDGKLQKPLITAAAEPHYLDGHILFTRDQILTAQPFDLAKLQIAGDAVPLPEAHIEETILYARSVLSVAKSGTLVYQPGNAVQTTQLSWFDRTGKKLGDLAEPAPYTQVALSPDAKSVIVGISATPSNLWLFDLRRGAKSRITFGKARDNNPVWSPDGHRFVYAALSGSNVAVILRDLSNGAERQLLKTDTTVNRLTPASWSRDSDRIFYSAPNPAGRSDVFWLSVADVTQHPYLTSPFAESIPRVSPDGKWVAYMSNETGALEVYLAPFPPTGAKWQVSTAGGAVPRWRGDGNELFYQVPNSGRIMSVGVTLANPPQIGAPVLLFEFTPGIFNSGMYDVTQDGQKFLAVTRVGDAPPPAPLVIVQNFGNELRQATEKRD